MRFLFIFYLFIPTIAIYSQGMENTIPTRLQLTNNVPADLLAKRSCVFYASTFSDEELDIIQSSFQKSGIDAVAYFKTALVFGGTDVTQKIADFLIKREIDFIVLISKKSNSYSFTFTPFNGTGEFVNNGQPGWEVQNTDLKENLQIIYRSTVNSQPIKNLLINSYPEKNFPINIIEGRRSDFFAIDLKVDKLAVPWFKDAAADTLLANFFKENYPFSYGMTEPGVDTKELRNNGFHYVLSYVHTEGLIARDLLGYQNTSKESAITSVTFPNGSLQLKTIPAETPVYKFYFKHLVSGNVFLGTKWDADTAWADALRNHVKGFKVELKIP
ncbi:MAG: hypothetical protein WAU36_14775 [Cyclobacteriaceae bacterium]